MISRTSATRAYNLVHTVASLFSFRYSCSSKIPDLELSSGERTLPHASDVEDHIRSFREDELQPDKLIKILQGSRDVDSAFRIFNSASVQNSFRHNVHTYYWMILKLGISDYLSDMESLCLKMISDKLPGVEKVAVTLIDTFLKQDKLDAAKRIICIICSSAFKLSSCVFNNFLGAFAKKKEFPEFVFVYKEMVKAGVAPDVDSCNCLLEVLFATGRVDSALDQYRRMNRKGWLPNVRTFEVVIEGLIANSQVDNSISTLNEMLDIGLIPDFRFYTKVIPLYCMSNSAEVSKQLFQMMKDANLKPDSAIFDSLLPCFCKNGLLDDAVKLLQQMVACEFKPSSHVLVECVSSFLKEWDEHVVFKVLTDSDILETSPFNNLLSSLCDSNKYSEASNLFTYMSKRNITDSVSWTILIKWLCEKREVMKASNLLAQMIVHSLAPYAGTYSAMIVGYCRSHNYDHALLLFDKLCDKGWVLDLSSYSELINSLCKAKRFTEAIDVVFYMCDNGCYLDSSAFHLLVKDICDNKMQGLAITLTWYASCLGISIENCTYRCILRATLQQGSAKHLLGFFSHFLVRGSDLDAKTYSVMLQGMTNFGQIKFAALIFTKMIDDDLLPDQDTIYTFLSFLESRSLMSLVSPGIDILIAKHDILDSSIYNLLVGGYLKDGNKSKALELLDFMLARGWVPDAKTHEMIISSGKLHMKLDDCCNIPDGVDDILAEGLGIP